MQVSTGGEAVWHNDGHRISYLLDHAEILVKPEPCHHGPGAECHHLTAGCVVEYFVSLYGAECNVGVAAVHPSMEIAWAIFGDPHDIDACQLWTIPVDDSVYASWAATQNPV